MKIFAVAFFILAFSSIAFAESLGVREINIGMPKEQVMEILKSHKDAKCHADYDFCEEMAWIKRAVTIKYFFGKETKKLTSINMQFVSKFYDVMLDGLVEKYGKPTNTKTEVWQNKMGAKFDNNIAEWSLPDGQLNVRLHGSKFDMGEISLIGNEAIAEMNAQKAKDKASPGF